MDADDLQLTGIAGSTPDYNQASLWSLVLHAAGIPHMVARREQDWLLLVPQEREDAARLEIAGFERENENWPPPARVGRHAVGRQEKPPTVPAMGALIIFYQITGPWSGDGSWFEQGAVDSGRILEHGEWWRILTGLTLHADAVHLLGNVFIGGVLAHFLCKTLGSGLGWALILLSGMVGNTVNVLLHGPGHHAVGFSTAVFGCVGLLSGLRLTGTGKVRNLVLPLGAAAGLLALLGSGGERTDLGAHLWGLTAGFFLGLPAGYLHRLPRWVAGRGLQLSLLLACCLGVWMAWRFAVSA